MRSLANILFFFFVLFIFWGCRPTKNLGEGQYLLNRNIVKSNKPELKNDLQTVIKQKPNRKILGIFRFHLGVYNLIDINETKVRKHWYQRFADSTKLWMKKTIGEEPVIYDSISADKSVRQMELLLRNLGYFNAVVKDTVVLKNKKAKVIYTVETAVPYTIRNIRRESKDPEILSFMNSDQQHSLMKSGENYDAGVLQKERDRLTTELRNRGYYFFTKEYIYFKVDSQLNNHQVDVVMGVRIQNENSKTLKEEMHHVYTINEVYIQPDYNPRSLENNPRDTLHYKNVTFISLDKNMPFKPEILSQKIYIKKNDNFRVLATENSYRDLSDLGVFKFTNIRFEEVKDSGVYKLNCFIQLTPSPRKSFSVESEGTYNGGIWGAAGNFVFRNKNTFKGAELLEFKLRGAFEAQKSFNDEQNKQVFNTIRVGPEISLNFQKLLLPFRSHNFLPLLRHKTTSIPISYNFERRPGYSRTSTNISFTYSFRISSRQSHAFTPVEINKVNVEKDASFEQKLLLLNDPFIYNSYQTHLTTVTRYVLLFSDQNISQKTSFSFFRTSIESSGNILRGVNTLLKSPMTNNSYKIAGVPYSQFIRPDADYRYYHVLNNYNTLVYRIYSGVGFAYKNATSLPIEKIFFAGGANDIRGWQARTLGPGSYQAGANNIDQNGDLKLEGNLEYRFYIFKLLEGAAFIDAGNVWALNNTSRPGSEFAFKTFFDEIAVAGGLGARLNFTFFIFRIDGGVKIKDPSQEIGKRIILQYTQLRDINWNIGIGYPF